MSTGDNGSRIQQLQHTKIVAATQAFLAVDNTRSSRTETATASCRRGSTNLAGYDHSLTLPKGQALQELLPSAINAAAAN